MTDRPELAGRLLRQVLNWRAAVDAQHERISVGFKKMRPERWADLQLYAYALRNILRACWAAAENFPESGAMSAAWKKFDADVPHAIEVRNTLDKFHNEELTEPGGLVTWAGGQDDYTELTLHIRGGEDQELVLDLDVATDAANRMAAVCISELTRIGDF